MARILTWADAVNVREAARNGMPRKELAKAYGVGLETIARIVRGDTHSSPPKGKDYGEVGKGTMEESVQRMMKLQNELAMGIRAAGKETRPASEAYFERIKEVEAMELTEEELQELNERESTREARREEALRRQAAQGEARKEEEERARKAYNAERQARWRAAKKAESLGGSAVKEVEAMAGDLRAAFSEVEEATAGPRDWG